MADPQEGGADDQRLDQARDLLLRLRVEPQRHDLARALHFLHLGHDDIAALLPLLRRLPADGCAHSWLTGVRSDWEWVAGDRALASCLARRSLGETDDSLGALPQVLLIGAPKSGTTSLLAYLAALPGLWRHPRKELHFLDGRWSWGEAWYRLQFPSAERLAGRLAIEATPDYLQDPRAPERAAALMPHARLIVLLREPLRRALSWFQHRQRQLRRCDDAETVITAELEQLLRLTAAERADLGWRDPNCLAGSLYGDQLRRWHRCYEEHQILVLRFEDMVLDPIASCHRVRSFLGLPDQQIPAGVRENLVQAWNVAPSPYPRLSSHLAGHCRRTLLREAVEVWQRL
jgi:hypothetical protein